MEHTGIIPKKQVSASKKKCPLLLLLISMLLLPSPIFSSEYNTGTRELIRENLASCSEIVVWLEGIELRTAPMICRFFDLREYQPAWTAGAHLTPQAQELIELFGNAHNYGLDPDHFHHNDLQLLVDDLQSESRKKKSDRLEASIEFLLTDAVFNFMLALNHGQQFLLEKDFLRNMPYAARDYPTLLNNLCQSGQIMDEILGLQPAGNLYQSCQEELELIMKGIKLAEQEISINDIKENPKEYQKLFSYFFVQTGYLSKDHLIGSSDQLADLILEYQRESGLRTTGYITRGTWRNISGVLRTRYAEVAQEIEQLRSRTLAADR